jgi:2-keto-3-deoxy-L-rhamnonate aldolase RhmA
MQYIRERVLNGEVMLGIGANMGSSLTVEMIGAAGFDWTWVDLEHGTGDYSELIPQMQATSINNAPAVVRIAWNDAPRFKRVLDLGAAGIMVPYVTDAAQAKQAARAMRYPPEGVRGVAKFNRACGFGQKFGEYFAEANKKLLTVVFIGPLDLSVTMGMADNYEHPDFLKALDKVAEACKAHGKAAGILVPKLDYMESWIAKGFTFLVVGSDGGCVAAGLNNIASTCGKFK